MAYVKITSQMVEDAIRDTDWAKLKAKPEAEIKAAVKADPDAAPIRTAKAITASRIVAIRKSLGLAQSAFAERYGIPLGTLRDWEQGKATPDATARSYLRAIEKDPQGVARAAA